MEFVEAVTNGFRNYVTFHGRACRSEYWYWALFLFVLAVVTVILDYLVFGPATLEPGNAAPINTIGSLLTLLPSIAVSVRRLHDVDRTGWWILIGFTIIGIIPLVYWAVMRGTWGPNRFGPNPLEGQPG